MPKITVDVNSQSRGETEAPGGQFRVETPNLRASHHAHSLAPFPGRGPRGEGKVLTFGTAHTGQAAAAPTQVVVRLTLLLAVPGPLWAWLLGRQS